MKVISYLFRCTLAVAVSSTFSMCAKTAVSIQKPANTTQTNNGGAAATDTTSQGHTDNVTDNCTYTVQPSEWFVDGKDISPGSVICIPAGNRGALLLKNFHGTETRPILIVNKGGKVNITAATTASYAFKTQNCQYFKVIGNGVPALKYGFTITGGNIGMTMDDLSSDLEIAGVEVRDAAFAGIMAKTDPSCDQATQRGHFTMKNVLLHDNYVHRTGGEGFYVGNSFYADGVQAACGKVLPHDVNNVKIYNNRVDSTGCEGIQVGSATVDCAIYNNVVEYSGMAPFASGQNNGIQIGEGTGGKCYANIIRNAPGNGIILLGLGDNLIANNYIINSGDYGIFADSRYTPGPYFRFINNTIINAKLGGIKLNSETIPVNVVVNNAIISTSPANAIIRMSNQVKLTAANNYNGTDVLLLKLVDLATSDLHLLSTSPLINTGADVAAYGVTTDIFGNARPSGGAYDIGAVEY